MKRTRSGRPKRESALDKNDAQDFVFEEIY